MSWERLLCLIGRHQWITRTDNILRDATNSETTITLCWRECPRCGASRLVFIYGNYPKEQE